MSLERFTGDGEKKVGKKKSRPKKVDDARRNWDTDALSRMGRKGAQAANEQKAEERARADVFDFLTEERHRTDEQRRRESTNENILTIDGEDPNLN